MTGIEIVFWYWWVFAVFMLGIELIAPGFFFLWLSLSGLIVGIELFLIPSTSVEIQLLIFSLLSMVTIFFWRRYGPSHRTKSDQPLLNKRSVQYIGRVFSVSKAIENGRGKIKIGDSVWTVEGKDCPVGARVEIMGVDGTVFSVKRADTTEDTPKK